MAMGETRYNPPAEHLVPHSTRTPYSSRQPYTGGREAIQARTAVTLHLFSSRHVDIVARVPGSGADRESSANMVKADGWISPIQL